MPASFSLRTLSTLPHPHHRLVLILFSGLILTFLLWAHNSAQLSTNTTTMTATPSTARTQTVSTDPHPVHPNRNPTPTMSEEAERNWKYIYPFHCAAQMGDAAALERLFEEKPQQDVNQLDMDGWSMLHYAAWYGHIDVIKYLRSRGCRIDICNEQGSTPLHFAGGAGQLETVKLLLSYGADPLLKNHDKQTPTDLPREIEPEGWQEIEAVLKAHGQQ